MDPLTVTVLASSVLSGIVQYYNAEKARKASKDRLNEIERLFNEIKPPDYDVSIIDPPEMHTEALKRPEFSGAMSAPKWNLQKLDLKDLEKVQDFVPQIAPMIEEAKPQLIQMNREMQEGRDAQKTALRRFMEVGQGDYDPEYQQRVQNAKRQAQAQAQSRTDSILQDYERRGVSGSGLELAAQMQGSADAMDRNAMLGLDAETQAYKNQLNALAQGAQLGGQIQNQEMALQGNNADIINAFNQRMTKRFQDWEQMRADALNQADLMNIQEAQRIADFNTKQGNQSSISDRSRMDDLARYNTEFSRNERDRMDDVGKWNYGQDLADRDYIDNREILRKQWQQGNIDQKNKTLDRDFENRMAVLKGKAGIADQRTQADFSRVADQNQAIQGVGDFGGKVLMSNNLSKSRPQNTTNVVMQTPTGGATPKKSYYDADSYNWGSPTTFNTGWA
jgi:hypothetical protein